MTTLGENYNDTLTVQDLRSQLTAKGYIYYAPSGVDDLGVWMHPLRARGVVVMGANSDLARVYQVQAVNNAIRRS
jgi:hypothetical protein